MHVCRLTGLVRIEKSTVRPPSQNGRHAASPAFHTQSKTLHTGKLSCFLPGISTVLLRSMASARAMRGRVALGMITSSI
jgi:hypothetical protein